MIDIAEKLFPNIATIITQLIATGIIYLLYRRFVHEPVMNFLDRESNEIAEAQHYAEILEKEAEERRKELDAEYEKQVAAMRKSNEAMLLETERNREAILMQAQSQREIILAEAREQIEREREEMLREVEDHVLDVAVQVSERTLENYTYDDKDLYQSLEQEWEKVRNETH